jgi:hypothetical protein
MILNITDKLIENRNTLTDFYDFFENIMIAYKESKHIICISPKKVSELLEDNTISTNSKELLKHYKNHSKSYNIINVKNFFNLIINIVENKEKIYIEDNIEYRDIMYSKFLDTSSIQKAILLGENVDDIPIYEIFVKYYQSKINLNSFDIVYNKRGGGGNTISKEYGEIYNTGENFCLCLLDSDKRYPAQTKYGATAQQVVDLDKNYKKQNNFNYKTRYYVLSVLELENCLPKDFYLRQYTDKNYIFLEIDKIMMKDNSFRKYFDFKDGISCKARFDSINNVIECKVHLKDYLCPIIEKENIIRDNVLLEGFSSKILKDFIKFDIKELISFIDNDSFVQDYCMDIGKYIASHVLVPKFLRAV